MRFSKASTLIEHERVCKGPVPLTRKDLPLAEEILKQSNGGDGSGGVKSDDSSVEIIEPPIKKNTTSMVVPNPLLPSVPAAPQSRKVQKDDSSVEIIEPPRNTTSTPLTTTASSNNNGGNLPKQSQYITCWTCDVCKVAHFKTFKEAEEHENQCMIEMEKKTKKNNTPSPPKKTNRGGVDYLSDSRQSSSAKNNNEDVVLFSPFVQGVSDSADFEKLSNCHAAILQSVKLLHHPFNGSVALQCQYCNEGLSTTWTLKKMTEMLPVQVCNHILECQNAPTEVVNSMQLHITNILEKSSEIVGELSLGSFLALFLATNGIVEGAIKRETRLLVLPDDKFRKISGFEMSKRGRQVSSRTALIGTKKGRRQQEGGGSSAESSPSAKRTKVQQSLHEEIKIGDMDCQVHYDDGRSMYVAPLDGLPLLTSMLEKEAKYLHPSQKVLLAQLEIFKLSPKMMKDNADIGTLGFRCQNCVTEKNGCCFMKFTSVNNLARDLLLFGKEHVVRCITKQKVTKQIHDALGGGDAELSRYCTLIATLYGMEERTVVGGKTQVVFGESPTIPTGYSRPSDIDVRSILRAAETNRMSTKHVDESSKATQKAPAAQDVLKAPAPAVAPVSN